MAGTGTAAETQRRFRAFISYSHRDALVAGWLHRGLEGYRVPSHLVGSIAALGPVPARLTPIFRDREDLPAATDLSAAVKAALAVSDTLIVICSPAAAASVWVGREIETFHALHPDRPVLLAIAEGEPNDCFPPAIRALAAEPLAADLRKSGDGRRLGLLKLVAGVTGLPLDRLVQRDAQRRQRRVMAVTLAAFAALILMSVLLALAVLARSESERQRQQAEGLVEYMLTDLRDRLKGVGRLDVMTAVNERAMAYYGEQGDLAGLPPESLERRARILHAMGEDDEKRGNTDLALAKFTEASRTTGALLAMNPDDPERVFVHAQSEFWVGSTAFARRAFGQARRHWTGYQKLANRLAALEPTNPRSSREVGYAEGNLCTLDLAPPANAAAALRSCAASLAAMERVSRLLPKEVGSGVDIANRHGWMADAWRASGNFGKAQEHRRQQQTLLKALVAAEPRNLGYRDRVMLGHLSMGDLFKASGDLVAARGQYSQALLIARQLVAADPQNTEWLRRVGTMERRIKSIRQEPVNGK